ncbi:MAG: FAD-binding oxidoreductase [Desulfuromonadales bacterium]|nr:FAD-binding oxidoreductase [Desulfuromonadales bacterium]
MNADNQFDVVVIGGGLQGCSVALHLAHEKKRVLIIERDSCGQHASGVNAGGLRRLNRLVEEIPLSMAAQKMWHDIESLVGSDCGFRPTGQVRIASNQEDLATLEARAQKTRLLGYRHEEMINAEALRKMVPAIGNRGVGALICRGDGFADPALTCLAFRLRAEDLGVTIRQGSGVSAIEKNNQNWRVYTGAHSFDAPTIVNCAGAWGDRIAAMAGDHSSLKKTALALMVTARLPHFIDPVIGHASRKLSFKQMSNGTLVIGGALKGVLTENQKDTLIDFPQMKESAETVCSFFPFLKDLPVVRCWAGIEGMTPDKLPIIGPGKAGSGVFHAFGFSAHGYQLAPIIGRVMTDLICRGKTEFDLEAFRINRFLP